MIDGRFELLARLGGGGMGLVWRARDLALHREVALKEVRPPDPALAEYDPEGARALRARVLREARALARIDHPNVVTIHHIVDGGEHTFPWLVMELVTGGSLQERLDRDGPLSPREAAGVGRGVLAGLRAAHAADIQHRDIKPANVLLRPDGRPLLTDFGIAAIQGSTALTAAGSFIGTPDYMAPERVGGQDGGPAADLWSLALMLYVAVEGRHPLRRANALATLAAVLSEDVPPPRGAGPLAEALMAVLVRDPEARPDAGALDELLKAVAAGAADGLPQVAEGVSDTPTSYPLAPPAPLPPVPTPQPHARPAPSRQPAPSPQPAPTSPQSVPSRPVSAWRRRGWAYAAALAVLPLSGALLWNLLPDGGGDGGSGGSPDTGSNDGQKLTIGIKFDMPGLGLKTSEGRYTGFDVDVARYIARALGRDPDDVEWKEARSADRESMLRSGDVDFVVATYVISDKREREVDFVGPYLVARQDVLTRVDDMTIARPADLNGKKVCATTGSASSLALRTLVAPEAEMRERDTYARCLTDLVNGAADAVTTDDAVLAGYAAQNPDRYRLGGFRLSEERYGIGVPKGSHLKAGIQAALDRMVADGSWKKALATNLPLLRRDTPLS
ncbi:bifunctional serine/threonine-protein kinase/glutamate ABC transporter substrate-binding protein [Streptomyces sp. NPDC020965]|uniref:bifunctional serine/threonine-protein kinase/glutamate ABC transporter substrate-binding protein n=1 Tax=Streptomyces sp. NPDC020965 TaxID=3365105 RepID=UPI0037A4EBBE